MHVISHCHQVLMIRRKTETSGLEHLCTKKKLLFIWNFLAIENFSMGQEFCAARTGTD